MYPSHYYTCSLLCGPDFLSHHKTRCLLFIKYYSPQIMCIAYYVGGRGWLREGNIHMSKESYPPQVYDQASITSPTLTYIQTTSCQPAKQRWLGSRRS